MGCCLLVWIEGDDGVVVDDLIIWFIVSFCSDEGCEIGNEFL